jgi:hypothetical protein
MIMSPAPARIAIPTSSTVVGLAVAILLHASGARADPPVTAHEEVQANRALLWTGVTVAGGSYAFCQAPLLGTLTLSTLLAGKPDTDPRFLYLAIPFAGPLVYAQEAKNVDHEERNLLYVLSGAQVAGTALIASAFLFPTKILVRDKPQVSIAPTPNGGGTMSISGTF